MHERYTAVENIVRKGEIACNKQFYPSLTMFSTLYGTYFPCQIHFKMSSAICLNLDMSKILLSGNELNRFYIQNSMSSTKIFHSTFSVTNTSKQEGQDGPGSLT